MVGILLFVALVPLALLVGVVIVITRIVRGRDLDWGELVRRTFQHLVALSLAFVAASGVSRLLAVALQGPTLLRTDATLAGPVAFAVVGVPAYAAVAWWLLAQARRDEREAASLAWSLHVGIVGIVSLVVSMAAAWTIAERILQGGVAPLAPVATLVVWAGLWAWYQWLEHHHVGSPHWAVLQVLAGTAIGLGTAVSGFTSLVTDALDTLLSPRASIVAVDAPWEALVLVVMGLVVWSWYWLANGMRRPRDAWWLGWVLLGGILSGLVATIGAAGYLLWLLAVWVIGHPDASAADHFTSLAPAVAILLSGTAVWAYHRTILAPGDQRRRTEVDRVHDLLLATVGLAASAGGFAAILVAIIEVVAGPGTVQVGDDPVNTLLAAVTFLVVGLPVWWRAWSRVQERAAAGPFGLEERDVAPDQARGAPGAWVAERRSPTRRVYLLGLFGIGALAALVSVLASVVDVLEDLFDGTLGLQTLYATRVPLAVLVTAAAIAALHWRVYQQDRDLVVADTPRRFPARVTLVGVADDDIVSVLADATEARVQLWVRADGTAPPWSPDLIVSRLDGRDADHVLVIAGRDGPEVIAVQD